MTRNRTVSSAGGGARSLTRSPRRSPAPVGPGPAPRRSRARPGSRRAWRAASPPSSGRDRGRRSRPAAPPSPAVSTRRRSARSRPQSGPTNSVSPSPSRSSVETTPPSRGTQTWAMRPPMSALRPTAVPRIEPSARERALRVELGHGPTLALVALEQPLAGPAAQDPGELPADVEAVADRRVESGAASRRHPVGGVADQERVALSESLGEPDPERDRHRTLDLDRQIGVRRPPRGSSAVTCSGVERVERRRLRCPSHARTPSGPACRREGSCGPAVEEVDAVAVLANEIPDRGAEEDREAFREFSVPSVAMPSSSRTRLRTPSAPITYRARTWRRASPGPASVSTWPPSLRARARRARPRARADARERAEVLLEQRLELVLCQARGRSRADEQPPARASEDPPRPPRRDRRRRASRMPRPATRPRSTAPSAFARGPSGEAAPSSPCSPPSRAAASSSTPAGRRRASRRRTSRVSPRSPGRRDRRRRQRPRTPQPQHHPLHLSSDSMSDELYHFIGRYVR